MATAFNSQTVPCYQDPRVIGGYQGGGGGGGGGGFDFTADQQTEIYSGMGAVFGLLLAAAAAIWGIKQLVRLFGWHGNQDE